MYKLFTTHVIIIPFLICFTLYYKVVLMNKQHEKHITMPVDHFRFGGHSQMARQLFTGRKYLFLEQRLIIG